MQFIKKYIIWIVLAVIALLYFKNKAAAQTAQTTQQTGISDEELQAQIAAATPEQMAIDLSDSLKIAVIADKAQGLFTVLDVRTMIERAYLAAGKVADETAVLLWFQKVVDKLNTFASPQDVAIMIQAGL